MNEFKCCDRFAEEAAPMKTYDDGSEPLKGWIGKMDDSDAPYAGQWYVGDYYDGPVIGIKFCPFCGSKLP